MNIFLNEYFGICFELNHFSARFNEKMNFQNVSPRATAGLFRFVHLQNTRDTSIANQLNLGAILGVGDVRS